MSSQKDITIESIDELESLLARAYWIESEFEEVTQWEAYASIDDKYKDLLFELSHDSEGHKRELKNLISNLDGLDVETTKKDTRARNDVEFKKQTQDLEILYEVYKNDKLALDLYQKIHSKTSEEFIEKVWEGEDPDDFFETFSELIQEEKRHTAKLKKYAQKVDPYI
ncbi:MAG: hypothetical protein ACOCSJ_02920 [Candidatus Natronoplasma sp.]